MYSDESVEDLSIVQTMLRKFRKQCDSNSDIQQRTSTSPSKHLDIRTKATATTKNCPPTKQANRMVDSMTKVDLNRELLQRSRYTSTNSHTHRADKSHNCSHVHISSHCRGEGLRTVVLARTKKGYGFVLRGAKG